MAKLVLVSGKISDVHMKNMQMYPFIYFNGVKEVKIDYDLSHKANALVDKDSNLTVNAPTRNNIVTYRITLYDNAQNENLERRFAALEASIRTLFWRDVAVEILFNDRVVYKSTK